MPKRKMHTLEELFEAYPEAKEIFIDAVERPIQRPKDKEKQREFYSGKKKRHSKEILYLGPTVEGKKRDYKAFKEEFPPPTLSAKLPGDFSVYADLGYWGFEKEYPLLNIKMPKKKLKGKELTTQEKIENREISSIRIKVEHTISGIKRFGIINQVFRSKKEGFDDKVMEIACGLWNYHLSKGLLHNYIFLGSREVISASLYIFA